jgi:hypothetical protein
MSDELQTRVCRSCDRSYKYPVPKSLATRFYCERCAQVTRESRLLFEAFNKRLRRMSKEITDLKKMVEQPSGPHGNGRGKD